MIMNVVELDSYFALIGLPEAGRRLVEEVRANSPVRTVRSRSGNVLTRFPSRKMQRAMSTESRTVEFPALIQYEHDPAVLEYYTQPVQLQVPSSTGGGKKPSWFRHIPDFLLLCAQEVRIEEWREEARLQKLACKYPGRFLKSDSGWSSPEVQTYLSKLGIRYRLRTPDEHPEVLVQNLLFLNDYYAPEAQPIRPDALKAIRACLHEQGAMTLADLIAAGGAAHSSPYA